MTAAAQQTAFFGKTYGEAMSLLVEARNYLAYLEPVDRAPTPAGSTSSKSSSGATG